MALDKPSARRCRRSRKVKRSFSFLRGKMQRWCSDGFHSDSFFLSSDGINPVFKDRSLESKHVYAKSERETLDLRVGNLFGTNCDLNLLI